MSDNPFLLKIKLKQHTPMIHFQSEQAGATLRATELKPKLDEFLITECFGGYLDIDSYSPYLIGKTVDDINKIKSGLVSIEKKYLLDDNNRRKEDEALENLKVDHLKKQKLAFNYKVKITVGDVSVSSIKAKYPSFFANMGNENKEKFFSFATGVTIEFFSLKTELIKKIKEFLPDFLLFHNFGTRQSKGFGSFYIDTNDSLSGLDLEYSFNVDVSRAGNESKKIEEVFKQIELFYKCLRSGVNLKDGRGNTTFYCKSLIFKYAKDKLGIQWEKKKIKQEFFLQDMKDQIREHNSPDTLVSSDKEHLVKDLLGLSTNENWRSYRAGITKKHKNGEIDRFKSPIFFKPMRINNDTFKVYFDVDVFDEKIFGQTFEIRTKGARNAIELDTPKDFDYYEFLDFVCDSKSVDISKHIDFDYHDTNEFEVLENIFNQL